MRVLHGQVVDVHGQMRWQDEFGFVNATVSLAGDAWSLEFGFRDLPDLAGAAAIQPLIDDGIDAIWALGRLKAIFGPWIGVTKGEKSILTEGFVAHCKALGHCVPFVVQDHYLRTQLLFGDTFKDDALKEGIARAFYRLLLAAPGELIDFEFSLCHIGAGITMAGGVVKGQVQYDEM